MEEFIKINDDIIAIDLGIFVISTETLIIADLHLGYLWNSNKFISDKHMDDILSRIFNLYEKILELDYKCSNIILNGDIKDAFTINKDINIILMNFNLMLKSKFKSVLYIKGNHDSGTDYKRYIIQNDLFITHGHELFDKEIINNNLDNQIKTIIIGHQHPAVVLRLGTKVEKYKCFLISKYKNKQLIVLPSFSTIAEGLPINTSWYFSPYIDLNKNLDLIINSEDKLFKIQDMNIKDLK